MQVIISHVNTDFDAFASLLAAKKLYPEATVVLSEKQNDQVRRFLNIYRDTIEFERDRNIDWSQVTEMIIVDVASLGRLGNFQDELKLENIKFTIYDHHPVHEGDLQTDYGMIEEVGATVTLLVEEIKRKNIPITSFEATVFGLGIYTDTGNFTYNTTTKRDFAVASYLMDCGMNLEMIQRFAEESLVPEQQTLLDNLFIASELLEVDGLEIVFASLEQDHFVGGLSLVTEKLLDMKGADAAISVVKMKRHVYIVGRGEADRVNLQPLLKKFGGGGHQHAGSATVKKGDFLETKEAVKESLSLMLQPPVIAKELMTSPVKTLSPETTIKKAGELMYRYGHSGYPIVDGESLVGIITRRDLDKANHHGLGHAPVKAYMTTNIKYITSDTTLEEIQKIVIKHNIGRLPVVEDGKVIGIVTRTNIIKKIHEQALSVDDHDSVEELKDNIQTEMEKQLQEEIYHVLQQISKTSAELGVKVYLIGGIVRDILLERENDDVDIVVEGDGIALARRLQKYYGGELTPHEQFGTATWIHPSSLEIDFASSRLEFYERPASLPDVEDSTLQEDLYRRDFTINAMAISLNETEFGKLVDPFSGQLDLYNQKIKTLHNLSFVEDPTRILRAVRFETRFQFKMDEQTENLALHSIEKMKEVSPKRIMDEIKRMFTEEDVVTSVRRLYELNFWQQYTGEQTSQSASLRAVKKLKKLHTTYMENEEDYHWFSYFSLPFFVSENPQQLEGFMLTREERKYYEEVGQLLQLSLDNLDSVSDLHRPLKHISDLAILSFLALTSLRDEELVLQYLQSRKNIESFISGRDLQAIGLQPGPIFKDILFQLEIASLEGKIESKDSAIAWVKAYVNME